MNDASKRHCTPRKAIYAVCLLVWLFCGTSQASSRQRCFGDAVQSGKNGLELSSSPKVTQSFLQLIHDLTSCETCNVSHTEDGPFQAGQKRKTATIFLSPWFQAEESNLLKVAAELLQKGMHVQVIHVTFSPMGDSHNEQLASQILSAIRCNLVENFQRRLLVRSELLAYHLMIHHPSEYSNKTSCQTPTSPYDKCALDLAEIVYLTLNQRYYAYSKIPRLAILPDVFVFEAPLVGGMWLAENLKVPFVILASPLILNLLTEKEDNRLAALRQPDGNGWLNLMRDRVQSLLLTVPFIKYNKVQCEWFYTFSSFLYPGKAYRLHPVVKCNTSFL